MLQDPSVPKADLKSQLFPFHLVLEGFSGFLIPEALSAHGFKVLGMLNPLLSVCLRSPETEEMLQDFGIWLPGESSGEKSNLQLINSLLGETCPEKNSPTLEKKSRISTQT